MTYCLKLKYIFTLRCLKSLATGRPPSFTLSFVDCELPGDPDATIDDNGVTQPSCTHSRLLMPFLSADTSMQSRRGKHALEPSA